MIIKSTTIVVIGLIVFFKIWSHIAQTCSIAKKDFCLIFFMSGGITGVYRIKFRQMLGIKPRTLCMLDEHSPELNPQPLGFEIGSCVGQAGLQLGM